MQQISPNKKDKIVKNYLSVMTTMMKHNYQQLSKQELENAILYSINKRYKEEDAHIYNNYKEKTVDMNLYEVVNYIMDKKPIMTAYGVLYQQHGKSINPLSKVFETFLKNRDLDKDEMYKYPPGSEDFEKYNLFQLLDKLDSNG